MDEQMLSTQLKALVDRDFPKRSQRRGAVTNVSQRVNAVLVRDGREPVSRQYVYALVEGIRTSASPEVLDALAEVFDVPVGVLRGADREMAEAQQELQEAFAAKGVEFQAMRSTEDADPDTLRAIAEFVTKHDFGSGTGQHALLFRRLNPAPLGGAAMPPPHHDVDDILDNLGLSRGHFNIDQLIAVYQPHHDLSIVTAPMGLDSSLHHKLPDGLWLRTAAAEGDPGAEWLLYRRDLPPHMQVNVLCHELAHVILGHPPVAEVAPAAAAELLRHGGDELAAAGRPRAVCGLNTPIERDTERMARRLSYRCRLPRPGAAAPARVHAAVAQLARAWEA